MKRVISICLLFLLLLTVVVTAETDDESDVSLITESSHGAEMRVLQLQYAIAKHVIMAQEIVAYVNESNTTALDSIIEEMALLKGEAEALSSQDSADAVATFVAIKKDFREQVKDFKDAVRPLLTEEDRAALQERLKTAVDNSEELAALREEIKAAARKVSTARVEKMLERMGVNDTELVEKVENGSIAPGEVIRELRGHYAALGEERRHEARARIAEKAQARRDMAKEKLDEAMQRHREQAAMRLEQLKERRDAIQERMQKRMHDAEELRERARGGNNS